MDLDFDSIFEQLEAEAAAAQAQPAPTEPVLETTVEVLTDVVLEEELDTIQGPTKLEEDVGDDVSEFLEQKPAKKTIAELMDSDFGDDVDDFLTSGMSERFQLVPEITKPWMQDHVFTLVRSIDHLRKIVDQCIKAGYCSLDLETEGLDNRLTTKDGVVRTVHEIVGFCICYDGVEGFYAPIRHELQEGENLNLPAAETEAEIRRLCRASIPTPKNGSDKIDPLSYIECDQNLVISFWNAVFDHEFLFPITGIDWWHPDSFEDGMLGRYCDYSDDNIDLKSTAKRRLKSKSGHEYEMIEIQELFHHGKRKLISFPSLPPDSNSVIRYAGSDAICTYILSHPSNDVTKHARTKYAFTYRLEKQLTNVLRVMDRNKLYINKNEILPLIETNELQLKDALKRIQDYAKETVGLDGLEPGSPEQLATFLFEDGPKSLNLKPKPEKTEGGQYKTDAKTLQALADRPGAPKILVDIVGYRQAVKFMGTYLYGLRDNPDKNSEIRIHLKQTGAASGRFSAPQGEVSHGYSGIPMQGIPGGSEVRRAFAARLGYSFLKLDYAAQELRIVTNVSRERVWVEEFLHGTGDLHRITAAAFFKKSIEDVTKAERNQGKCVHPDTLVTTKNGLIPIKMIGAFSNEPESFFEGNFGSVRANSKYNNVKALYNGGVKEMLHVVTSAGIVTCTPEHRFVLRDGTLVKAGDLLEGSQLIIPEVTLLPTVKTIPTIKMSLWEGVPESVYTLTQDWAYLAGLYAGDGTGNTSSISITHGRAEKEDAYGNSFSVWISEIQKSVNSCGLSGTPHEFDSIYLGSRVIARLFEKLELNKKHGNKALRVPSWVMNSKVFALQYLGGLFDSDGTVGKYKSLDCTTKDFVFAGQLAALMRACGLDFNTELTFNNTYKRYYVRLRLTVTSSWEMKNYLRHIGKRSRLRAPIQLGRTKDRFTVVKILPAGLEQCLDLTIDSDEHLYQANGFLTHNTANFALVYGGGPTAIQAATGCDKQTAIERKAIFDKALPMFAQWVKQQKQTVRKDGGIRNAFHRWIAIPDINHELRGIQAGAERAAVNYPIQSAGADIMKISMVLVHKRLHKEGWLKEGGDDSVRILMSVHDELVYEVRHDRVAEVIPILVDIMESPWKMPRNPQWVVPLVVEPLIGFNWKSGFGCRRYVEGMAVSPTEVLINGFLYDILREPKINKKDEVVESLDKFEFQVGEGKKARFHIKEDDAPWIVEGIKRYGRGSVSIVAEPEPLKEIERDTEDEPTSQEIVEEIIPDPWDRFMEGGVLRLQLVNLETRVMEQVMESLLYSIDEQGIELELRDPLDQVLVERGRFLVSPHKIYHLLSEANLIRRA